MGFMYQRHPVQSVALMLVTTVTLDRRPIFANPAYALEAIETLYRIQSRYHFEIFGFVIMPEHCHFLVQVPEGGSISKIMRLFKCGLTFQIGKGPLWQQRFHMRLVRECASALRYIHGNPIKAGLVKNAEDYRWSSAAGKWPVTPISY